MTSKNETEEHKNTEPAVMNEISSQVLNQQEDPAKKKKPTKKASADGLNEKINGLLLDDEDQEQQQQTEGEGRKMRGPKIDENVLVKICDMGNGCWTHHHFTPEIQTR